MWIERISEILICVMREWPRPLPHRHRDHFVQRCCQSKVRRPPLLLEVPCCLHLVKGPHLEVGGVFELVQVQVKHRRNILWKQFGQVCHLKLIGQAPGILRRE